MESSYKIDKLDNYIEQIRGISYKSKDISEDSKEGYKVVLRANSIKDNKLILNDLLYVKEELIKEKQFIKCNDILMAASSGSKDIVGKCVQIKDDTEYTFGAFCKLIRCKENINPNYVAYFFRTPYYRATISAVVNGANINNLKNEHIDNLLIPLPSKEIQKRIVDVLDKAQELIDKRKGQIEQLDELVKSRFIEMFDKNDYPIVKAEDVCEYITKGTTPKKNEIFEDYTLGLIPYLKVYNLSFDGTMLFNEKPQYVTNEVHNGFLARSKVYPNDVLMNIVGPPLGKFSIVPNIFEEWNINQAIAIFRATNKIKPLYLLHALKQPSVLRPFIDSAVGVRQQNLSLLQCRNLEIPLPPIELQDKFENFVKQVNKLKVEMEKSLKELEDNFNSLMQKAFKGELF